MTPKELQQYDGRDGRKAYVAYKGVIYDVTDSSLWKEGTHKKIHQAGEDLTAAMEGAPHSDSVFEGFTQVGRLEEEAWSLVSLSELRSKEYWFNWYQKYHPHPMIVHFPIALHFFAAGMDLIFFINPHRNFESSTFYAFFAATVLGFIAMIPGILSWWVNYDLKMIRALIIKLYVATATLLLGVVGIVLRLSDTDVAYHSDLYGMVYHFTILITVPAVIVLAYYGGKLTWRRSAHKKNKQATPAVAVTTQKQTPPSLPKNREERREHKVAYTVVNAASLSDPLLYSSLPKTRCSLVDHDIPIDDFTLMIGGPAGSGIQSIEAVLVDAFKTTGYYLFSTKEYMSRIREGSNTVQIRIASQPVSAPKWKTDLFVALDANALEHVTERLGAESIVLGENESSESLGQYLSLAMMQKAGELGGSQYVNSYAAGSIFGLLGLNVNALEVAMIKRFGDREKERNINAVSLGYKDGLSLQSRVKISLPSLHKKADTDLLYIDGTTACGFGFLAGGCNFVASYPMSPSTGVLNFMAAKSEEFTILLEQAEDEIAAFNMVLGAWYAGARGLTTTSGGGFALMSEGMSLSGMTETPAVVYLAQRPGPATGLPTRSEQGDLSLVVNAGHGEFPRIILAPGDIEECVDMGYLAFELADRYQVPVVLLSDQYLADSIQVVGEIDFSRYVPHNYIVKSGSDYRRYVLNESGISPRAIPGYGEGLVCCVSDEHDERGQITEDYQVREAMVEKRHRKTETIRKAAIAPTVTGKGEIALVGWGSSKGVIEEVVRALDESRLMHLHFNWVYPLNREHLEVLKNLKYIIVIENNSNAQFTDLLRLQDIHVDKTVLQANGFAFFADQLSQEIQSILKEMR